ncbi:unnamed protein product [Gongylonema pulchrum]|uniref:Uncharacterized protein n=1 Tax=Gongylonema pulchrum TaxID=637853 RepID=A0A183DFZ6_9BILA|nr:unnamed protein product [Gongylonema pulchrum]
MKFGLLTVGIENMSYGRDRRKSVPNFPRKESTPVGNVATGRSRSCVEKIAKKRLSMDEAALRKTSVPKTAFQQIYSRMPVIPTIIETLAPDEDGASEAAQSISNFVEPHRHTFTEELLDSSNSSSSSSSSTSGSSPISPGADQQSSGQSAVRAQHKFIPKEPDINFIRIEEPSGSSSAVQCYSEQHPIIIGPSSESSSDSNEIDQGLIIKIDPRYGEEPSEFSHTPAGRNLTTDVPRTRPTASEPFNISFAGLRRGRREPGEEQSRTGRTARNDEIRSQKPSNL